MKLLANEKGMNLISTVVAMGIGAIVILALLRLKGNLTNTSRGYQTASGRLELARVIKGHLSCENTLSGFSSPSACTPDLPIFDKQGALWIPNGGKRFGNTLVTATCDAVGGFIQFKMAVPIDFNDLALGYKKDAHDQKPLDFNHPQAELFSESSAPCSEHFNGAQAGLLWSKNDPDLFRANGKVGIQTTTLTEELNIDPKGALSYGVGFVSSGADRAVFSAHDWWDGSAWQASGNVSSAFVMDSSKLTLRGRTTAGSATWMSFHKNGGIGIGADTPLSRLYVGSAANKSEAVISFTNGAMGESNQFRLEMSNLWGFQMRRGDGGTSGIYVSQTGGVGLLGVPPSTGFTIKGYPYKNDGSTLWKIPSDRRLKKNLGAYDLGLDEIMKLETYVYRYKKEDDSWISDENSYGVLAQDVQKVFPEAVSEGDDGYLRLNGSSISWALVNSAKELDELLSKDIDELKELANELSERRDQVKGLIAKQKTKLRRLEPDPSRYSKVEE